MVSISTIKASSFLGEVGAGVTKPFRLECNGEIFISKVIDEDVGSKHLVNEYVCYKLAKLLDIPIPDASLIQIDNTIIDSVEFLRNRNIQSRLLFGSKMIESAQTVITPPLLEIIINKYDIPSIILFDQIIYNDDRARNKGNLIIDFKKKKLFAIDHTHVFRDGALWNTSSLQSINDNHEYIINTFDGKYYKMLKRYVTGNNPFAKVILKLNSLNEASISSIVESIPEEWDITIDERKELKYFILHRISNVHEILKRIKDLSPQWKGVINSD